MTVGVEEEILQSPEADAVRLSTAVREDIATQADLFLPVNENEVVEPAKPKSMMKHLAWTATTSFGVMGVNLITGILVSRLLEPSGRGEVYSIWAWTQTMGWAGAMGFYEAMTYMRARNVDRPERILGTGLLVTALFGTLWLAIAEWLIPHAFSGQSPQVIFLARIWMCTIYTSIGSSILNAMVAGDQKFGLMNMFRFIQPIMYLISLLTLWSLHCFTPLSVMCVALGGDLLITGCTFTYLLRTIGVGRPSMIVLKDGLSYGLKVQGALFASLANARLDMLLLPAMLTGMADIGLYSVSGNLSSLVIQLLGSFSIVVFPSAARSGSEQGMKLVMRSLRFVLYAGGFGSFLFFLNCPWMMHLVYGPKFDGALPSLRVLLPGGLAIALTKIVDGGLQSVNKPLKATYAQLVGVVITVVGLMLLLRPLGILGAAIVSTISYSSSLAVSLYYLTKEADFSLTDALSLSAFLGDVRLITDRLMQASTKFLGIGAVAPVN